MSDSEIEVENTPQAEPEAAANVAEPATEPVAHPSNLIQMPSPARAAGQPEAEEEEEGPKVPAPPVSVKEMIHRADADDASPISVTVAQVYEGPFDLLLDLIRKQDIDIYDIPIAKITAQFLAYVERLKSTDMDSAGEFIYMASLLIHIKSKMLLPRAPSGPEEEAEDPRRELVERLLEHERFKNAAQMLLEKQMLEAASWSNPGAQEFKNDAGTEQEIAADTTDLVRVFRQILDRMRQRPVFNVNEDQVTVGQMLQFLSRRLTMEDKPIALRRLLSQSKTERALIAAFLALLELVRLQAVLLRQDRAFGEIYVKKHDHFESAINEAIANARDDWQ
jgi:segregation and condensation protein A